MVFSDQTYSVLVVSAAQKFNEAFAAMLPGSEYYPVRFVGNIAAARREMVNKTYDLVIINAPLPDDFGTRFAIDACNQSGTVALLLAKSDVYDEMEADLVADGELLLHYDKSDVIETDRTRYLLGAAEVSEIDQNGNECSINLFTLERTIDYVNKNLTVVSIGGELVPALRLI